MSYAIQCGSCGNWQGYNGNKPLKFLYFKCFHCGKTKKIFNKPRHLFEYRYREVKDSQQLPLVIAELNNMTHNGL